MQFISEEPDRRALHHSTASLIGSIGNFLGARWFSNVHRAQLKRYRRGYCGPGEMVALRVLAAAGVPIETMRPAELARWTWLVHCMALLSNPDRDPHGVSSDARPGRMLHKAGYSDFRLRRLLVARGERFQALFEQAIRRVATLGEPIDWAKLAPLILPQNLENAWTEDARAAIARDFAVAAVRGELKQESSALDSAEELPLG